MNRDGQETNGIQFKACSCIQWYWLNYKDKTYGWKRFESFNLCEVTEVLQMSRNFLFKHSNFLTVFKNSVDRVFLQPGNFLNLLLIAGA